MPGAGCLFDGHEFGKFGDPDHFFNLPPDTAQNDGGVVFYTFLIGGIFTIAFFIYLIASGGQPKKGATTGSLRKKRKAERHKQQHTYLQPATLEEAEALARDGNFGDAVRKLLALSLQHLAEHDLVRLRPSMTGREIVRHADLHDTPRGFLRDLVGTVESYAFAEQPVEEDRYRFCFNAYKGLLSVRAAGQGGAA